MKKKQIIQLNYATIGKRIQKNRVNIGYTQKYIADLLNISASHMSNIETGNSQPSLETISKISRILDCSLDALIFGDEESTKYQAEHLISELENSELELFVDIAKAITKKRINTK